MKFSQFENFVDFSQNVIYNIVKGGDYMNNLRKLRISKNMQQKELAAILNIKISTYCQYETGKRQPDYETLKNCKLFQCFHRLFTWSRKNCDHKYFRSFK